MLTEQEVKPDTQGERDMRPKEAAEWLVKYDDDPPDNPPFEAMHDDEIVAMFRPLARDYLALRELVDEMADTGGVEWPPRVVERWDSLVSRAKGMLADTLPAEQEVKEVPGGST